MATYAPYDPGTAVGTVRLLINDIDVSKTDESIPVNERSAIFSDEEIGRFLSLEGSDPTLAAARALTTIANNKSLLVQRRDIDGTTVDYGSARADYMKAAADLRHLQDLATGGINAPADGYAEIAWNDFAARRIVVNAELRADDPYAGVYAPLPPEVPTAPSGSYVTPAQLAAQDAATRAWVAEQFAPEQHGHVRSTMYRFSANNGTPPGAGQVRYNVPAPAINVTKLYVAAINDDGLDHSELWNSLLPGDLIRIGDRNNSSLWTEFAVGPAGWIDQGVWFEIDVIFEEQSTTDPAFSGNEALVIWLAPSGGLVLTP